MPKILVNLFFVVTRMTDEDGRIERVRDVENIVKMHMRFFKNVNYKRQIHFYISD